MTDAEKMILADAIEAAAVADLERRRWRSAWILTTINLILALVTIWIGIF